MGSINSSKKPGQLRAFLTIAWYAFKAQTRNPSSFAFGFMFPIVFISIFGLIGNASPTINVGLTNESSNTEIGRVVEKQQFLKIEKGDQQFLETRLRQGKISGIINVEEKDAKAYVRLISSSGFPQETATLRSFLSSVVDKSNLKIAGVTDPPTLYQEQEISGRKPRYIDFALPGQIGFSLLSTAVFGTVFGLIYLKKALILKRMFATPTKALTILLAQGTSRLFIALLQTILILAIGVIAYKFYLPNGWITFLELILLSTIGLIAFLGFGYFLAGIANDENSAGPLVNIVTLPQFLLSGTFFPIESLPAWLQPVAHHLPLSYFNVAVRKITTEYGTIEETIPYMLGLIAWGVVMYLLAARTFKWE